MYDNFLSENKALFCVICLYLWCKYSRQDWFQATKMNFTELEAEKVCTIDPHKLLKANSSTSLNEDINPKAWEREKCDVGNKLARTVKRRSKETEKVGQIEAKK